MPLQVIPAIDLLGSEAVRLEQGDFARVTTRADATPEQLAKRFSDAGARLIHVVDLTGSRTGRLRPELIAQVAAAAAPARIQASGGVRSLADARALLDAGAQRVVVGTAAFEENGGVLSRYVAGLGEQLVVALDIRGGVVHLVGWSRATTLTTAEATRLCVEAGVARLLCTAIERDGTLSGPDVELLTEVVESSGLPVLAAGGIADERDLEAVAAAGCEGAIVGRALLDGRLPLERLAAG